MSALIRAKTALESLGCSLGYDFEWSNGRPTYVTRDFDPELDRIEVLILIGFDSDEAKLEPIRGLSDLLGAGIVDSAINSTTVSYFHGLAKLTELSFHGSSLSSESVGSLCKLAQLSVLNVGQTFLTSQDIITISLALPNCKIHADELRTKE